LKDRSAKRAGRATSLGPQGREPPSDGKRASFVLRWQAHIQALAGEIGPRGSTRQGERQASAYCARQLARLRLHPRVESFVSARSIFTPHLVAAAAMLLSFAAYPVAGRFSALLACALSALALISDTLELSFRDNLLRRLVPKGHSQNVIAVLPLRGKSRQDLVLIGHVDSQRTPIIFSTPRWLAVYQGFTTVAFALFAIQVGLYLLGFLTGWRGLWWASIPSAVAALLLMALCLQAETTPFTPGANDNASSVGYLLALAEDLSHEPLEATRVWLAFTGCEEVQHYGAIEFLQRHARELSNPVVIAFEMLACSGPAWLTREGIVIPFRSDPRLVHLAERIAQERPECRAHAAQITGGNTEMADALRLGIPAITLTGIGPHGESPYWHQQGDRVDKVDPDVLRRTASFVEGFLRSLDREGIPVPPPRRG
jgi:hypothetical protein